MKIEIKELLKTALIELKTYADSLKQSEGAYIVFLAHFINKYSQENNLGLFAQMEVSINNLTLNNQQIDSFNLHRIADLVIYRLEDKPLPLAIIECFRPSFGRGIIQHLDRMKSYFIGNEIEYFYLSIADTNKNYWNYYLSKLDNYTVSNIEDTPEIKSATFQSKNEPSSPIQLLYLNLTREENVPQTKIEYIELTDFKSFSKISVPFSPSINIILGENGVGKTTLLQALAMINLPDYDNSEIKYKDFVRQDCEVSEISLKRIGEKELRISIDAQKRNFETDFARAPFFLAYGANVFSKYNRQNDDKEVKKLLRGSKDWYYTKSLFKDFDDELIEPLGVLKKLSEQKDANASLIFEILKSKLETFLIDYKIVNKEGESAFYFLDKQNKYLETYQLSEGYRTMCLLLSDIMLRIIALRKADENIKMVLENAKGVVVIDEFDRHLHASLQRQFVSSIKKNFPNIQFFLTTHNPMAILDRENNEIILLEADENEEIQAITYATDTKYIDIAMIYLKYFVNDIVSEELRNDLEKYNFLVANNQNETEEFHILEQKLKSANAGHFISDLRYWKFLDFLKRFPEKDPTKNHEKAGEWVFTEEDWKELINQL